MHRHVAHYKALLTVRPTDVYTQPYVLKDRVSGQPSLVAVDALSEDVSEVWQCDDAACHGWSIATRRRFGGGKDYVLCGGILYGGCTPHGGGSAMHGADHDVFVRCGDDPHMWRLVHDSVVSRCMSNEELSTWVGCQQVRTLLSVVRVSDCRV